MPVRISGLKPTIEASATLFLAEGNGVYFSHKFSVYFKRIPTSRRDELNAQFAAGKLTVRELLDEVVSGWSGMTDENNIEVPYSHAERAATDEVYPGTDQAIAVSWFDVAFINQREASIKNSKAQSDTISG